MLHTENMVKHTEKETEPKNDKRAFTLASGAGKDPHDRKRFKIGFREQNHTTAFQVECERVLDQADFFPGGSISPQQLKPSD